MKAAGTTGAISVAILPGEYRVVTNSQSGITPILTVLALAPGASTNFTGSYFAPTNCTSTSTSTATAQSLCGIGVTNTATTICPITTLPLLAITQNCPINPVSPGSLLTYTGSVSNAGNVALNNIIVTNSQSGITPLLTVASLVPGATTNFTGSYFAPTNCSSTSIATATAQSLCGVGVTNTATTVCPISTLPLLAITQNCPINPVSPGSLLTYTGSVSNAGDVALNNIIVTNSQSGITPILTVLALAPGATTNFTGSYFAPTNCSSTSIATATAQSLCGVGVTNTAITICPITTLPLLAITQNCPINPVSPGSLLTYTGTVSNAGNITLNNIIVTNSQSGITPLISVTSLAPGATTNFTGSYFAPTNCSSTSTSTATAQSLCGIGVTNTATTICPITTTPLLAVTQVCPVTPAVPGGLLTYSGTVSNAGDITLNNIIVTNSQSGITPILTVLALAPGATTNFTGSYFAPTNCSSTSTSTATAQSLCGIGVTNTATTICPITTTPSIVITETCPPGPVSEGSSVTFGGSVENTGNITLTNVLVFSSQGSSSTPLLGPITLAPGASEPFTGSYIATGGSNPTTNSTIVTNSSSVITTNTVSSIVTNNTSTVTTNTVTPTFGTIDPVATTLTDRFNVPSNLHGLMYADQDENWGPTLFYSTWQPASGADTFDTISTIDSPSYVGSLYVGLVMNEYNLTYSNYDALTLAAPDVGYGAVNFYYVRHDSDGVSHFGVIKAAGATSDSDLPAPLSGTGYTGLAFAAANVGYGADMFYYVRNDAATGLSMFGTINPTPGLVETDLYSVGTNFDSLVFVPGAVSTWGTGIFAYLHHDNTGSIIGTINPVTQVVTDRIDLGTNFLTALTFTATDVGYGPNLFYYLRPAETILTTNTVTNFTTNIVITLTTNTVSTYTTNSVVTFTATNTVMTSGMDICQGSTVAAAANCLGPVALALAAPQFRWPAVASALAAPEFSSSALANGLFRLSFRSQNGTSYTIQYKNALADPAWTDLETVLGTGGNLSITDRDSAQRPSRFYRIILTP
jgi:uncharacterized repeat protein (TIGR01451 family)